MWDEDFDGMAASLAAHDRILLQAISDHEGYVFSTAGDAYGAAFATAGAAVAAAVQSQLGLHSEPWTGPSIQVRMGIHTGRSEERAGNYFGPDVNRGARVMSAANGGQILLSAVTAGLLAADPDVSLELIDHGSHSLKDLDRAEQLFEVRHPGLPEVKAPLKTVDAARPHLPRQLTSFVGREGELEKVVGLLTSARLVTLTGVGGTGKTRLSMEVGTRVSEEFADGVWMVELAPVMDPELVDAEVADLWHLRAGEGASTREVIRAYVASRSMLIIIDNCEHVLESASGLVADILASSPGVSILATSRESLGVPGESVFRVPSLGLPVDDEAAVSSDAVRLFLDRAERVRPGFAPDASELHAIVQICRRLDGIPLGIELAAARLRSLSAFDLEERLHDSFKILTGGSKTAVPRQRTLQTAIDWSYDLLDDDEAVLFRRLSVFSGGFDLAAAEVVGVCDRVQAWEVLDLLDQLVDKSLVVTDHGGREARFRMLEPIRQYGQERLVDRSESRDAHLSHARHFAALVAENAPRLRGPEQQLARTVIQRELDNVRSALSTLLDEDVGAFVETCFHLIWFWTLSSLMVEGRDLMKSVLESLDEGALSPPEYAKASMTISYLATMLTDPSAVEWSDRGIEAARRSDDDTLLGWLLMTKAMVSAMVGTEDAVEALEEGVALLTRAGAEPLWDAEWDAAALSFFRANAGGPEDDRDALIREAMERYLRIGDRFMAAQAMVSSMFGSEDQPSWLLERLSEAVDILRELDARHGLGHALFYLGVRRQDFGAGASIEELSEATTMLAEVGDLPCSVWCSSRLIARLVADGHLDRARSHLSEAVARLMVRDVHSDIEKVACAYAVAVDDLEGAARLLGQLEASGNTRPRGGGFGWDPSRDVDELRSLIESGLSASSVRDLTLEGGSADRRQVLRWMRDLTVATPAG